MESIKLQKYISMCGVMSRRAAETEIQNGLVFVNGVKASVGDRVDPENDTVTYKGKRIRPCGGEHTYIMLNKPIGVVTTMKDEEGRTSVAELTSNVGKRVYPVGRLDMYSEGLLILTDDGELCQALSHPSFKKEKVYTVSLVGNVPDETLATLSSPMTITEADGKPYRLSACPVSILKRDAEKTVINITLSEGRNRQIRRMCDSLGLKISRLTRISEGGLSLGKLPRGKWRYLTDEEIQKLKENIRKKP